MNGHILERLERAAEKKTLDIPCSLDEDEWTPIFNEQLVKLTVLECCQKLEDDGMVEVAMEMKQHFGVEE